MSAWASRFVLWAARLIGSLPGATLHVTAFAPWAIVFLTFAVLSAVIWRSALLRMSAIPLAVIGLCGAANGPSFDMAIAATGDALALRGADGTLSVLGHHPSLFSAEQWLRADADSRDPREAVDKSACDRIGCVGILPDGRAVALGVRPPRLRRGLPARRRHRHAALCAGGLRRPARSRPRETERDGRRPAHRAGQGVGDDDRAQP